MSSQPTWPDNKWIVGLESCIGNSRMFIDAQSHESERVNVPSNDRVAREAANQR